MGVRVRVRVKVRVRVVNEFEGLRSTVATH